MEIVRHSSKGIVQKEAVEKQQYDGRFTELCHPFGKTVQGVCSSSEVNCLNLETKAKARARICFLQ